MMRTDLGVDGVDGVDGVASYPPWALQLHNFKVKFLPDYIDLRGQIFKGMF